MHAGAVEFEFGDGSVHRLGPGGHGARGGRHPPQGQERRRGGRVYVIVGAKGGYVGRDGHAPEGEVRGVTPIEPSPGS